MTLVKVGQRVGVGAQASSCGACKPCQSDNETYCQDGIIHTVGSKWPESGIVSQGGLSSHTRVHEKWAFPIPDGMDSKYVSPMLCAGITAYSPLVSYGNISGKKIGVIGLGGIGHFAVLWGKALGAEVWVLSRSRAKEDAAVAMGADGFIATGEGELWHEPHRGDFTLILNTASSATDFDLRKYLSMIDVRGHFISVGMPAEGGFTLSAMDMVLNGVLIGASHIGNRRQVLDMLQLASEKGIKPWVEEMELNEENLILAMQKMMDSKARFRITMTGYSKAFSIA